MVTAHSGELNPPYATLLLQYESLLFIDTYDLSFPPLNLYVEKPMQNTDRSKAYGVKPKALAQTVMNFGRGKLCYR